MPGFDQAKRNVQRDIEKGIGHIFGPFEESAVSIPEELEKHLLELNEATVVAVPWIYKCQHIGIFQDLLPTHRAIEMHGVTFVNYSQDGDNPVFHRYVDWLGVMNQLGLEVNWRVPIEEEDYSKALREYRDQVGDDL